MLDLRKIKRFKTSWLIFLVVTKLEYLSDTLTKILDFVNLN
jgi:hypothetical protein